MTDNKLTDVTDNNVGKMNDNEIKKALDYWEKFDKEIDEMLLARYKGDKDLIEQKEIVKITFEVFDLINRLQARVEKSEKVEHFADKTIATLQAENERLEKNIETETNHITRLENQIERLLQRIKTAKAEAYKEFAEKYGKLIWELKNEYLKKGNLAYASALVFSHTKLQNLLKKLVGEDNESKN